MNPVNYTSIRHLLQNPPEVKAPISQSNSKETLPPQTIRRAEPKPLSRPQEKTKTDEVREVVEHKPPPELRKYVNHRPETIKVSHDLAAMGIEATSAPAFPAYQTMTFPISDDRIFYGRKAPFTSSLRWLATLAWYVLRKAHLSLRKIHGKVVRVIVR